MKYLLMIYEDENGARKNMTEADLQAEMAAYYAYGEELEKSGIFVAGEALHPITSATTVRVRDGKTLTTDGPFAETKEQLGGYYLLECKDLDEAIVWAAKIPGAKGGSIEIRPIVVFS
ncbi:MAG TPA: YciI family protein [Phototrophicaceae bacterium]|jgi:hypothetical protein|nr:YciI family protein [Phototrophicaceae bacterium]